MSMLRFALFNPFDDLKMVIVLPIAINELSGSALASIFFKIKSENIDMMLLPLKLTLPLMILLSWLRTVLTNVDVISVTEPYCVRNANDSVSSWSRTSTVCCAKISRIDFPCSDIR